MDIEQEITFHLNAIENKKDFRYFTGEEQALSFILSCIDLTSLNAYDTDEKIIDLCNKSTTYHSVKPATVCVYPVFVGLAKERLRGSSIGVASVAGGFPSGQTSIDVKLKEVQYALQAGADEIDIVISRGKFLEGKYDIVYQEIEAIRNVCKGVKLKVILETGELESVENITKASEIAIKAGADYIKTSTGKIAVNVTPETFVCMLLSIKSHYEKTGKQIGIKASGGISDVETAFLYLRLLENVLGEKWLHKDYFRIGTSRLLIRNYGR